ncbi:hypothetical protein MLD38_030053 [Melastoma candidum]|uniref:Uncharacterized protein n=1 Tax=Melastoma candidum TaxID=119954 RepID=A0ACB9MKN1_9MYRT|nr:hypothetical protein MLD38_030053 [Melastoma candidum]
MEIDLSLPSGEIDKAEEGPCNIENLLDGDKKLHDGDLVSDTLVELRDAIHATEAGILNPDRFEMEEVKEYTNLEPLSGMEFESHGEAYSFYQEYARSVGFNTAIQNSRRSKTSREFIDAKFACSRYGTKREYDKSINRPRARQVKQDPDNSTGRRACGKTDCKASMHVKRRTDGKWVIHSFVKEHNHELLPAQAISEKTRRMYAEMAKQFAEYKNVVGSKSDYISPHDKGRNFPLDAGDMKVLLEFMSRMQTLNSNFFYAVDLADDQRLRNLIWVDAKGRHDYINFSDVVSFDTTYLRSKYKIPMALFIGVNQHYQALLLGCAILSDESATSYSWLMRTWLRAVGGLPPKMIITDQEKSIKTAVADVFPGTRHYFFLWHIWGKLSENLMNVMRRHENFLAKFEKCVIRSWTEKEFEKRWWKIIARCELKEDSWLQALYEDRAHWVPTFMKGAFLAGMCTTQRAESINSVFDKYLHKKTSVQELVKQYEVILLDRYEEESKADSDALNKQPVLKSPSPFEKSLSLVYTHTLFKKFQGEVLGAIACHPKKDRQDESGISYKVQEFENNQEFIVLWNEIRSEVSCACRLFEYKGYLCRHALIVLQISGLSSIPPAYIMKRWTRESKNRNLMADEPEQVQTRVQRYNNLCLRSLIFCEEASHSQESYNLAFRAIGEAFVNCISMNSSDHSLIINDPGAPAAHGLSCVEHDTQPRSMGKTSKKKNPTKKRKMTTEPDIITMGEHESLQQMDKLSSRAVVLDGYYGTQPSVQEMVQLNLIAPTRDSYYSGQQTIQGLGQLNSIAPSHDGYYTPQQGMHGLEQMDFFRSPANFAYGIRDDRTVRTTHLPDDTTRQG